MLGMTVPTGRGLTPRPADKTGADLMRLADLPGLLTQLMKDSITFFGRRTLGTGGKSQEHPRPAFRRNLRGARNLILHLLSVLYLDRLQGGSAAQAHQPDRGYST